MASFSPPVLLIHGLIGSLRDLVPVFAEAGVDAHAPDLLGYGALADVSASKVHLPAQVAHLAAWLDDHGFDKVCVVGHSVGGAIGMLFAHAHPERVASIVSVEGNFSLADAFWSAAVARMTAAEARDMLNGFRADPSGWLARSGISHEPAHVRTAIALLANQPSSTIQAMACSVVEITGALEFDAAVRSVFRGAAPIHLVAGDRSRQGWSVPEWALVGAASDTVLPGGHMMMVENPDSFARTIVDILRLDKGACR